MCVLNNFQLEMGTIHLAINNIVHVEHKGLYIHIYIQFACAKMYGGCTKDLFMYSMFSIETL